MKSSAWCLALLKFSFFAILQASTDNSTRLLYLAYSSLELTSQRINEICHYIKSTVCISEITAQFKALLEINFENLASEGNQEVIWIRKT